MGETRGPSVYLTGLNSRSIHTIYAGSFVVYLFNLLADWCHMYYAVKGWTVTFPLKDRVIYLMIVCCSVGAVLNFLLLHLCCENALWHRWTIEPYEGGCRMICQKLCHWITDFDCFRISFLIMVFEDAPMTMINFWLISGCSIPHTQKSAWPFYLSCGTTTISLIWRGVMIFFAYRSVRFMTPSSSSTSHNFQQIDGSASTLDDFKNSLGMGNNGQRIIQYDECWPVRTSVWIAYHREKNSNVYTPVVNPPDNVVGCCCQALFCFFMCQVFTIGSILTGCAPCCYHYVCRKNAARHRHKFAKTCTGICTTLFNGAMLSFSVILLLCCLILNILWLSSVHLLGNDHTAPEINQLCVSVDAHNEAIQLGFMPNNIRVHTSPNTSIDCKSLFDEGGWGFWWERKKPTAWVYVKQLDALKLAVWTEVHVAVDATSRDITRISYDVAYRDELGCHYAATEDKWKVSKNLIALPFPYWVGCDCRFKLQMQRTILCNITL